MMKLLASCALVLLFAPGVLAQTAPTPVKATPQNAAAFLGDWTLNGDGPNGPVAMTLSLTPEGQALKVAFALRDVPQTVSDTTLADGALAVTLSLDTPAGQLAAALTLTRSDGKTLFLLDAGMGQVNGVAVKKP